MNRFAPVAALLGAAAILTGCAASTSQQPNPSTEPGNVDFGHVHGLGVDTTSGVLFAASHQGVFEVGTFREGIFTRSEALSLGPVAGRAQDTMGFEMYQHRMYGSGHPDPNEGLDLARPNLGLIVSDDWGTTWTPVSLHGEVDFHDIAVTPDGDGAMRVYGYDASAGTVLVSTDGGESWTPGAEIQTRDLTTDQTDPDTVYATTEEGLTISTDAGASFSLLPNAPALMLVESTSEGFMGIATDGTVWLSDANQSWRSTGTTEGEVEAMTWVAEPEPILVVMDARGISASRDDGATWETVLSTG
jgi:photosystem II stability/assembly factor-like uncharacterized protein